MELIIPFRMDLAHATRFVLPCRFQLALSPDDWKYPAAFKVKVCLVKVIGPLLNGPLGMQAVYRHADAHFMGTWVCLFQYFRTLETLPRGCTGFNILLLGKPPNHHGQELS